MKNKALTTLMATAITATLVWPIPNASATSSEVTANQSHFNDLQAKGRVATSILSGEKSLTITNVTSDTVRTSLGQFKISNALKPIFKATNRQALMNADATVIVKNDEITSITALTLKNAGTNKKAVVFDGGDAKIAGDVTVNADYIKILNLNIASELTVTNRVKKAITIDNVSIGDTITFKPLATRKIEWLYASLKDIEAPNIIVQRTKLNITADKIVPSINVKDKVTSFEVTADVKKLVIDVENDFSLYGEGKIEEVIVKHGARVALDSAHQINKVQVDAKNAKVTMPIVNKTELSKLVSSPPYVTVSINGNEILFSDKWTTQAERTVFESAVANARTVANNTNASQEQVLNAITQYKNALANYQAVQKDGKKYSAGDKTTLTTLINSVQYVTVSYNGYELAYNTPWTTQSEKDTLVSAVTSAQYVVNNYYSTYTDISNAITNLENAIWNYKNAYKYSNNGYYVDKTSLTSLINSIAYAQVSQYGTEIPYYQQWTTQEAKNIIDYSIQQAYYVINNSYATQQEVTNAISNLQSAIYYYESAKNYGSQTY
ncbi:S-layer protein [Lysinibacillus sp. NPDC093712]|uniref:S-layer protein n=1 Tax=Lysinibacillus sp. NPDC093712 TaxID=3390579 RepID=UPI003D03C948